MLHIQFELSKTSQEFIISLGESDWDPKIDKSRDLGKFSSRMLTGRNDSFVEGANGCQIIRPSCVARCHRSLLRPVPERSETFSPTLRAREFDAKRVRSSSAGDPPSICFRHRPSTTVPFFRVHFLSRSIHLSEEGKKYIKRALSIRDNEQIGSCKRVVERVTSCRGALVINRHNNGYEIFEK